MRRFLSILLTLLLCSTLILTVSARSGADNARYEAVALPDGSCQVKFSMTLTLDTAVKELYFPLPAGATDATVNGAAALIHPGKGISLSGIAAKPGTYSITIGYRLPGIIEIREGGMTLQLQLLCGFSYPVDNFTFSIRLPDTYPEKPAFTSGYHQETIIEHLNITLNGDTLYGSATGMLKDHETLQMQLPVTQAMFPQTAGTARLMQFIERIAYGVLLLAVVFYLIAMRPHLRRPSLRATVPAGLSAGDVALWLTGMPMDFSLMIVSWARMGYLQIQSDPGGRVLLHKRMEMGNERSSLENKLFSLLFHRRKTVDATGEYFARLHRKVSSKRSRRREVFGKRGYFHYILQVLCLLSAALWGFVMGGAFHPTSVVIWVLMTLVAIVLALLIHRGGLHLLNRRRSPVWIGVGAAAIWLGLGIFCGKFLSAALLLVLQGLLAAAAVIGGNRTATARQNLMDLLDLWLHLLITDRKQLQHLLRRNADYFHDLAPYALALNADRLFARRYGKLQMPECNYLQSGHDRHLTASQFSALLRKTVDAMDARAKRLPWDRLRGK